LTRGLQNPRKKLGTKATQAVDVSGFELFEPATSSNVKRVRYDAANERLHVEFRTGSYRYEGVPRAVFDELTKLKNPSGARFKAFDKIIKDVPIRWGLTGSFTSNGLEDVFGQCKIVDQTLLGRAKGAFMQQYFVLVNKDFGEWAPRVGSLAKVMDKIKPATFVLEPGEYKDKLPPLHVVEVRCDLIDRKPYEKMKADFVVEFPNAKAIAANGGVVTGKLQQMASGFVYDTRKEASETPGKFIVTQTPVWFSPHKFDRLEELLDENQHANTIIVYQYQEELAELKRRFNVTTLDDDRAIERWNKGEIRRLAVHYKSAVHGQAIASNVAQPGQPLQVVVVDDDDVGVAAEHIVALLGRAHCNGQL